MTKEKPFFLNEFFFYEKIDTKDNVYFDVDIDIPKLKYILAQIKREDGHLHLRIRRKEHPTASGLTHNVSVSKKHNPEFYADTQN